MTSVEFLEYNRSVQAASALTVCINLLCLDKSQILN